MKASEALRGAWTSAALETGVRRGYYRRRLDETGPLAIYAGIETPGRLRKIIVRIPQTEERSRTLTDSTRGYTVTEEKKSSEHPDDLLVHVCETGGQVPKDLFLIFCSDIVENIAPCRSATEAVSVLYNRLQHWRRFFQARIEEGLTREAYIGLYAELEFLERCLTASVPAEHAVRGWSGPRGTNQDYLFGPVAIEIKATTGNDPDLVRISNARQLDSTGLDGLYLA